MTDVYTAQHAAITQLRQLLKEGDEAQRCYAARAIALAKVNHAETELNDCLYHYDPDVVTDAASALSTTASGDLTSLLDVAHNHPESDARMAALDALAQRYLSNSASEDASQIMQTLCTFAKGRSEPDQWGLSGDWDDWWDVQLKAVQLLGVIQDENNNGELNALFIELLDNDPEPELELALFKNVLTYNAQYLVHLWQTKPKMTQRRLARAFATSSSDESINQLVECLTHSDSEIKKIALKALTQHQAHEHILAIIACLNDQDTSTQQAAKDAIEQFNVLNTPDMNSQIILNRDTLFPILEQANTSNLPTLISLLKQPTLSLRQEDKAWLEAQLTTKSVELILAIADYAVFIQQSDTLETAAINACLDALNDNALPLFQRAALVRMLGQFPHHSQYSFDTLTSIINNEENEVALRQPAIEAMLKHGGERNSALNSEHKAAHSDKWLKGLLLGLNSQENTIAVTDLSDKPSDDIADKAPQSVTHTKLEALLADHNDKFGDAENTDSAPNSTLAAIQQTNVEAALMNNDDVPDDQTLLEMIDDLDDEFTTYRNIVKDHLDTGERLSLNRKKIARLPQTDNKRLMIRALGHTSQESSVALLLEALLGASAIEQHEIFQSLCLIAKSQSQSNKMPSLRNGLGAAGYTIHYGDELCKQSAAQFLAYMPLNKALPLLLIGANDANEHVRVCSLTSLLTQLKTKKLLAKHHQTTSDMLTTKLHDPAGGVRKLAFQLLALIDLQRHLPALVELAVSDQESQIVAAETLATAQTEVLMMLASNIADYDDHRQPLAIQLTGELLAS